MLCFVVACAIGTEKCRARHNPRQIANSSKATRNTRELVRSSGILPDENLIESTTERVSLSSVKKSLFRDIQSLAFILIHKRFEARVQ